VPELPDVETVARRLRRSIIGRRITGVRLLTPSTIRTPPPQEFVRHLTGRRVVEIGRRGKYLLIRLRPSGTLVTHLRMTGDLLVGPRLAPVHPHTRVVIQFGRLELRFVDQRRFGHMDVVETEEDFGPLQRLGVEPLERSFTLSRWRELLAGRRGTIKGLLLRQDLIAGIGNIYADEILWQARIHPARPSHRLRPDEIRRLHGTIRRVLQRAVAQLSRYGHPVGRFLNARGEDDARCPRCGRPLRTARIAGRTTYFCPHCQR
jgi:formamidopyrimidine-DNA glycosylase